MKVMLVRHGAAVDLCSGITDGERWLTAEGRRAVLAVARAIPVGDRPCEIITSPFVRAVQTAEIMAGVFGIESEVTVLKAMAFDGRQKILHTIESYTGTGPLMLVGHEPTQSALTRHWLGPEARFKGFSPADVVIFSIDFMGVAKFEAKLGADLCWETEVPE